MKYEMYKSLRNYIKIILLYGFQSNESRLSATTDQIVDEYLTKSESCNTSAND